MEAIGVALIVAIATIVGPLLVARQHNRRLDTLAKTAAATLTLVSAVERLADGSLTAAYRAEVAALEAQLVAMRRPSPDTQTAIKAAEARLVVLRQSLADRETALLTAQRIRDNG